MFPINWNDVFRKKDGTLGTMEDLGGGGSSDIPSHTSADAGKVLTVGEDGELEWHEAGGAGGVYVGTTPPDSSLGSNGEYYYLRDNHKPWTTSDKTSFSSNQQIYGTEYTFISDCKITSLSVFKKSSATGISLRIGNSLNIITTLSDLTCAEGWNNFILPEPITVSSGDVIIIQEVSSNPKWYTQNLVDFKGETSVANATAAYYGSEYPGTRESGTRIFVSFEFETPYYIVESQYYKTNNAWSQI